MDKNESAMRYRRAQGARAWEEAIEEAFKAGWDAGRVSMLNTLSEAVSAPEDPTPKEGDYVRVVEDPIGYDNDPGFHKYCAGQKGTMYLDGDGDYCAAGHAGPLSDFEKIGNN